MFLLWLADGFKQDSVRVEPGSFIWKGLENIVEHDATRVGKKMTFMLSMFADPLLLLIMVGRESYLLEFKKGAISGIERVRSRGSLKNTWLNLSRRHSFVHLAFKVDPKILEQVSSSDTTGLG